MLRSCILAHGGAPILVSGWHLLKCPGINACVEVGDLRAAQRVAAVMRVHSTSRPSTCVYCTLPAGCVAAARGTGLSCKSVAFDIGTGPVLGLPAVCVPQGACAFAFYCSHDILQEMGHPPDVQAWNTLIKGYARAGVLTILPDLIADMQMEVTSNDPECMCSCFLAAEAQSLRRIPTSVQHRKLTAISACGHCCRACA